MKVEVVRNPELEKLIERHYKQYKHEYAAIKEFEKKFLWSPNRDECRFFAIKPEYSLSKEVVMTAKEYRESYYIRLKKQLDDLLMLQLTKFTGPSLCLKITLEEGEEFPKEFNITLPIKEEV
jgi:hypothetical protein